MAEIKTGPSAPEVAPRAATIDAPKSPGTALADTAAGHLATPVEGIKDIAGATVDSSGIDGSTGPGPGGEASEVQASGGKIDVSDAAMQGFEGQLENVASNASGPSAAEKTGDGRQGVTTELSDSRNQKTQPGNNRRPPQPPGRGGGPGGSGPGGPDNPGPDNTPSGSAPLPDADGRPSTTEELRNRLNILDRRVQVGSAEESHIAERQIIQTTLNERRAQLQKDFDRGMIDEPTFKAETNKTYGRRVVVTHPGSRKQTEVRPLAPEESGRWKALNETKDLSSEDQAELDALNFRRNVAGAEAVDQTGSPGGQESSSRQSADGESVKMSQEERYLLSDLREKKKTGELSPDEDATRLALEDKALDEEMASLRETIKTRVTDAQLQEKIDKGADDWTTQQAQAELDRRQQNREDTKAKVEAQAQEAVETPRVERMSVENKDRLDELEARNDLEPDNENALTTDERAEMGRLRDNQDAWRTQVIEDGQRRRAGETVPPEAQGPQADRPDVTGVDSAESPDVLDYKTSYHPEPLPGETRSSNARNSEQPAPLKPKDYVEAARLYQRERDGTITDKERAKLDDLDNRINAENPDLQPGGSEAGSETLTPELQQRYDDVQSKFDRGEVLTDDEFQLFEDKLRREGKINPELDQKKDSAEQEPTDARLEKLDQEIEDLGTDIMYRWANGLEVSEEDLERFQEMRAEQQLLEVRFTPEQAREIAKDALEKGRGPKERREKKDTKLQEKIKELMTIDMKILAIPKNVDQLRSERQKIQTQARIAHSRATTPEGREKEYALYMQIANINAAISSQKYEAVRLGARRSVLEADVRRGTGMVGPMGAVVEYASSRIKSVMVTLGTGVAEEVSSRTQSYAR